MFADAIQQVGAKMEVQVGSGGKVAQADLLSPHSPARPCSSSTCPPPPSPRQDNLHQVPAGPGLPWDTHRPRANHGPIRGGLPWPGGAQVGQGTGPDTCFCHPLALHAVCIGPPCPCPAFPCYPQHLAQTLLPSTSRSNAAQTLAQTLLPSTSRSNAATHHVFTSFHLTTPPGPNHLCLPAGSPATRWQCSRTSHTRCVCV